MKHGFTRFHKTSKLSINIATTPITACNRLIEVVKDAAMYREEVQTK